MRPHRYSITNRWTGNLGTGTSSYTAYSRAHELSAPGKLGPIPGSSDPAYRGDPARYNPEELLVGALSACHMLWVLHLCADAGIVIVDYLDHPEGETVDDRFTSVTLRPRMNITDAARRDDAAAIHARVHEVCCLARSVNFPVHCEPEITIS
jgi:organic hydroperoxide reductase OsmC/OhrA